MRVCNRCIESYLKCSSIIYAWTLGTTTKKSECSHVQGKMPFAVYILAHTDVQCNLSFPLWLIPDLYIQTPSLLDSGKYSATLQIQLPNRLQKSSYTNRNTQHWSTKFVHTAEWRSMEWMDLYSVATSPFKYWMLRKYHISYLYYNTFFQRIFDFVMRMGTHSSKKVRGESLDWEKNML